jgi:RNase adaptor protein for sRNA GlmZ degradation
MIYTLIAINFMLICLVYFSFKDRLKPKENPEHNQNVIDIINLVTSEEWVYDIDNSSLKTLKFEKGELNLNIHFTISKNENDNKFTVELSSFTFRKGFMSLFRLDFDSKNQDLNVKKLVHNLT